MSAPQSIELSNVTNVAKIGDENDGANGEYLSILPSETESPSATLDSAHATYESGPTPDRVLVLDAAVQHTQQPGPLPQVGGKEGGIEGEGGGVTPFFPLPVLPTHSRFSKDRLLLIGIFLIAGAVLIGIIFALNSDGDVDGGSNRRGYGSGHGPTGPAHQDGPPDFSDSSFDCDRRYDHWDQNASGADECFRPADCPDDDCYTDYGQVNMCSCSGRCYNETSRQSLSSAGAVCCCEERANYEISIGRPFSVKGVVRVAHSEISASLRPWSREACASNVSADFDPSLKNALGMAWARAGAAEHASVASFSRHSLQLLSLGAPPDLLERVQQASLDEIRHARLSYSLASRYLGREVGPGRLDVRDSLGDLAPAMILGSVVTEGCVGETVAAVEARLANRLARDTEVAGVLATIAADEAQHAELAWAAVVWMLSPSTASVDAPNDPDSGLSGAGLVSRAAVAANFKDLLATGAVQRQRTDPTQARMRDEGILTPADRAAVRAVVLQRVVAPALDAILTDRPARIPERIAGLPLDSLLGLGERPSLVGMM